MGFSLFWRLLVVAVLSAGCRTGQSARELFTPDTLQVFGAVGDGDFEGEWRGRHAYPIDGDLDTHTLGLSIGWSLTAADREAQRETTRAVRELAAKLDALAAAAAPAPAPVECEPDPLEAEPAPPPEKCGTPSAPPQEPPQGAHATQPPDAGGLLGATPGDLEAVLYALGALVTAIVTYLGRHKIGRAHRRYRDRRRARRARTAGPSSGS